MCVRNGSDSLVYYCPSPEPLINNVELLDFHIGTHTCQGTHIESAFIHHLIHLHGFSSVRSLTWFLFPLHLFNAFRTAHVSHFCVWTAICLSFDFHFTLQSHCRFITFYCMLNQKLMSRFQVNMKMVDPFLRHINQIESYASTNGNSRREKNRYNDDICINIRYRCNFYRIGVFHICKC